MRRFEALKIIMNAVDDELVVVNIGHPCQEVYAIKDRPENFYMLASMGLSSSIGLGLAMSCDRKVVAIDGDGSVLMNLGTLATIGVNHPKNYVLIVIDNGAYGSTGFQPTFTSKGVRIDEIAKACGIENTVLTSTPDELKTIVSEVLKSDDGPHCVVVKAEMGVYEKIEIIPHDALTIKNRFMETIVLDASP